MKHQTIECPAAAIQLLSADQLKIYLALKLFIKMGGEETVYTKRIATALKMEQESIRLNLIHMITTGWLTIDLYDANYFYDDERLKEANWVLQAEQEPLMPGRRQIAFLESVSHLKAPKNVCNLVLLQQLKRDAKQLLNNLSPVTM